MKSTTFSSDDVLVMGEFEKNKKKKNRSPLGQSKIVIERGDR